LRQADVLLGAGRTGDARDREVALELLHGVAVARGSGECPEEKGLVAYYSNRCPYSEYHVREFLPVTARNRNLPLKAIKLTTME
jgi:hypothetical protein